MEGGVNKQVTALEPENKEKCTINDSVVDVNQYKLQCSRCKRRVRFRRTLLLPYQQRRYLTFGKNWCTFVCSNCAKWSVSRKIGERTGKIIQFQKRNRKSEKKQFEIKRVSSTNGGPNYTQWLIQKKFK